jgi:plasmid stability protein
VKSFTMRFRGDVAGAWPIMTMRVSGLSAAMRAPDRADPMITLSWDITWRRKMTDVLIRDVPEDVIAALDAHAARLGLSRSEYVRRRLAQDAATPGSPVSVEDLARFAGTFADLADPDVMSQAWT